MQGDGTVFVAWRDQRGIALPEAMMATLILASGLLSLSYVSLASARVLASIRAHAVQTMLAREKVEQLRGLAWSSADGAAVSDTFTDTGAANDTAGGTGLSPSPGGTLLDDTAGYCDFFDADGRWVGEGVPAPRDAVWARRWAIHGLAADPDTLVIEAVVVPLAGGAPRRVRPVAGAHLMAVRARHAR